MFGYLHPLTPDINEPPLARTLGSPDCQTDRVWVEEWSRPEDLLLSGRTGRQQGPG